MLKRNITVIIFSLVLTGCGYMPVTNQNYININNVSFENNIPNSFKIKFKELIDDGSSNLMVTIEKYQIKERKIYGGPSLRALESELKGELTVIIYDDQSKLRKKFISIKNFSVSELNPLAEKETVSSLEDVIQKDLINQLTLEVRLIEM